MHRSNIPIAIKKDIIDGKLIQKSALCYVYDHKKLITHSQFAVQAHSYRNICISSAYQGKIYRTLWGFTEVSGQPCCYQDRYPEFRL
jgi:hypothetical protein